jgi:hypothetical protein
MFFHRPVALAYLFAMAVCLALGVIALAVGLLLAVWPRGRQTARWLAGGTIGSLLFLVFFQGLSLPVLVLIAAVPFFLGIWSGPADTPNMIIAMGALGLMLAVFLVASIAGLIAGWGIGARVASGMSVRGALSASRALTLFAAGLGKLPAVPKMVTPERGIAIGVGIMILTAGGLALARIAFVEAYGSAEMDYRGKKIQLAKKYVDYHDYKNDPDNLASSEVLRVERMMTEAHIGPNFTDWKDFVDQAFTIKFPGYGMGPGPKVVAAGREFIVEVIEIPRVSKDRYFVLEKMADRTLRLVDDFVTPHGPSSIYWAISSVRLVDGKLVYSDHQSKIVRETPMAP